MNSQLDLSVYRVPVGPDTYSTALKARRAKRTIDKRLRKLAARTADNPKGKRARRANNQHDRENALQDMLRDMAND